MDDNYRESLSELVSCVGHGGWCLSVNTSVDAVLGHESCHHSVDEPFGGWSHGRTPRLSPVVLGSPV